MQFTGQPNKTAMAVLQSTNVTHQLYGDKNFQDIEEIQVDDHSAIMKDERGDTSSHGHWSSDIHDETPTVINTVRIEPPASKQSQTGPAVADVPVPFTAFEE